MKTSKTVAVRMGDVDLEIKRGTPIIEILKSVGIDPLTKQYTGAIIHNRLVGLKHRILGATTIALVTRAEREGFLIYMRSACLVLAEAAHRVNPQLQLVIGQAIKGGYHVTIENRPPELEIAKFVAATMEQMRAIVAQSLPFRSLRVEIQEAEELFASQRGDDKIKLLSTWRSSHVPIVSCGEYYDIKYGPLLPHTGYIDNFELEPYALGFVLQFSTQDPHRRKLDAEDRPKLFKAYTETRAWNSLLGVTNVGQLNELCLNGGIHEIIKVSEGFHEKKIAQIADDIVARHSVRIVLIAGPSSSGKTTFSKRLALQLRVNGVQPVGLSLDNYYVDREATPRDSDGNFDFEALEAIDLERFNGDLVKLLDGQEVATPRFDFPSGKRVPPEKWVPMVLEPGQLLIIEGIHGLNDQLTRAIPTEKKFKVYISALTQLCIDNHNRIFTSDTRLIRRIVRDRAFRGYSAAQSIEIWPRVKRGELRNIYPFQEDADVMFNSALVYEPAVLHVFAERFLMEIKRDDPARVAGYRLRKFIDLFVPIAPDTVPQTSILREFIGGSWFKY